MSDDPRQNPHLAHLLADEADGGAHVPPPRYARPSDTSVDDRGEGAEPFRVMIRVKGGYRTEDYWSHWASYATQGEAERMAKSLADGTPGATFLGTWRFAYPLP